MTNPSNTVRIRSRNGGRGSVYEANMWAQKWNTGLYSGSGVLPNSTPDMNVRVGGSSTNPDVLIAQNPVGYHIVLDLVAQVTLLITAPATNSRISSIVAYTDDLSVASATTATTGTPASCGLIVVNGTTSASPTAPSDSTIRSAITADGATGSQASYCVIASLTIASSTTTITSGMTSAGMNRSSLIVSSVNWNTQPILPTSVAYNGQRSYTLTYPSSIYSIKSPGQRNRIVRTVASPTQSTSLNGTNKYWAKTSPNKMTFTTAMTATGYAKPSAYQYSTISSCTANPGVTGWRFYLDTNGTIVLNAGARLVTAYQSAPLNKYSFFTASLNLATGVGEITVDGVVVPSVVSGSGTSFTQSGNLNIGATNGAIGFFPGTIAQAAIFSAVIPAATLLTYFSQGLTGTEPNLVSAYSFNGVATDLMVATPNDLTAMNSAGYVADAPWGAQADGTINSTVDYGITMSVAADGLTEVIQVPEGCTIPTSGGISSMSYSGVDAPYGFPLDPNRHTVLTVNKVQSSQPNPTANVCYNLGMIMLLLPVGNWNVSIKGKVTSASASAATYASATLSTANNTESDPEWTIGGYAAIIEHQVPFYNQKPIKTSIATTFYLNERTLTASTTALRIDGNENTTIVKATNAYL